MSGTEDHATPSADQKAVCENDERNPSAEGSKLHSADKFQDHQASVGFATPKLDLKQRLQERSTAKRTAVLFPTTSVTEVKATPLTSRLKRHLSTTKKIPENRKLAAIATGAEQTPSYARATSSSRKPVISKLGVRTDSTSSSAVKPKTSTTNKASAAKKKRVFFKTTRPPFWVIPAVLANRVEIRWIDQPHE